jgi:hypothetical protein
MMSDNITLFEKQIAIVNEDQMVIAVENNQALPINIEIIEERIRTEQQDNGIN